MAGDSDRIPDRLRYHVSGRFLRRTFDGGSKPGTQGYRSDAAQFCEMGISAGGITSRRNGEVIQPRRGITSKECVSCHGDIGESWRVSLYWWRPSSSAWR